MHKPYFIAKNLTGPQRNWIRYNFLPGRGHAQCQAALERLGILKCGQLTDFGREVKCVLIELYPMEPA